MFDWGNFKKGNFEIICETKDECREFLKQCQEQGIKFSDNPVDDVYCFEHKPFFDEWKQNRVCFFQILGGHLCYGFKECYKFCDEISFKNFLGDKTIFTQNDFAYLSIDCIIESKINTKIKELEEKINSLQELNDLIKKISGGLF